MKKTIILSIAIAVLLAIMTFAFIFQSQKPEINLPEVRSLDQLDPIEEVKPSPEMTQTPPQRLSLPEGSFENDIQLCDDLGQESKSGCVFMVFLLQPLINISSSCDPKDLPDLDGIEEARSICTSIKEEDTSYCESIADQRIRNYCEGLFTMDQMTGIEDYDSIKMVLNAVKNKDSSICEMLPDMNPEKTRFYNGICLTYSAI